jgi:hypothetical protein
VSRRPRLRDAARRRDLRARAAHVVIGRRLAALYGVAIARWGFRLPPERAKVESLEANNGAGQGTPASSPRLCDAFAWARCVGSKRAVDPEFEQRLERAVTVYDGILALHLPREES